MNEYIDSNVKFLHTLYNLTDFNEDLYNTLQVGDKIIMTQDTTYRGKSVPQGTVYTINNKYDEYSFDITDYEGNRSFEVRFCPNSIEKFIK